MNLCHLIEICCFMKCMNHDICFTKRKACNIFGTDKLSVLGMVLLTELTAHPSSLRFEY